ncbi:roadblock/LC7 domain-containing protein [Brevibacterium yomogidense]|uniref:hypothetical protein n=1 Tax=Brevibacterium yomogidense TaxID=946573 RepID=UPI001E63B255|nr:hypothetical protein [Brevibacterium yomogidense]
MPLRFWRRETPEPEPARDGDAELFDSPEESPGPPGAVREKAVWPTAPLVDDPGAATARLPLDAVGPAEPVERTPAQREPPAREPSAPAPAAPESPAPASEVPPSPPPQPPAATRPQSVSERRAARSQSLTDSARRGAGPPTEPLPQSHLVPVFADTPLLTESVKTEDTEPERVRALHRRSSPSHSGATTLTIPRGELGREPRLTVSPNTPLAAPATTEKEEHMSQIDTHISELLAIDGATGAAVVDISSGMALATGGAPGFDLTVAAAGNSNVVRAKLATMKDLALPGKIEDIMITLENQYHIVNVLNTTDTEGLFIYLVLDRAKANLALARHKLTRIAAAVSI